MNLHRFPAPPQSTKRIQLTPDLLANKHLFSPHLAASFGKTLTTPLSVEALWAIIYQLVSAVMAGIVQLWGLDPKAMELAAASGVKDMAPAAEVFMNMPITPTKP